MLMKYATLWLFTLPVSPCNMFLLFTPHFRLIYSGLRAVLNEPIFSFQMSEFLDR